MLGYRLLLVVLLCVLHSACAPSADIVIGNWSAEETSFVKARFYPDGEVVISGIGVLNLSWSRVDSSTVRIRALDGGVVFEFEIEESVFGETKGVLTAAGFDTLTFSKINK